MLNRLAKISMEERLFLILGGSILSAIFMAWTFDFPLFLGFPAGLLLAYVAIVDFEKVFYLLVASLPFSTDFQITPSLGTDLPSEPLMLGLTLIFLLFAASQPKKLDFHFYRHPLILLVFLHLIWLLFTSLHSHQQLVSFKFFAAKMWYVTVFVFMAGHLIKQPKKFRIVFWCLFIPMIITTLKIIAHHFLLDFGFTEINIAVLPFYRNHVDYAGLLAIVIPIGWIMRKLYPKWSWSWWTIVGGVFLLFIGLIYSYTRAAYLAVFFAGAAYWVIRFRLMRYALAAASIVVVAFILYLSHQNKYLDFAPTEQTVAHKEFGDIVSATSKLEDVSTMERYYRWVAGARMSQEQLLTGFGPGNFYSFYKFYALAKFRTYVSDNPEKSGVHNYFLMVLIEQGIVGLLIFLILTFAFLIIGERVYHESEHDVKHIVMLLLLSTIVIDAFLLMNDMLETDKFGPIYFMNIAILVNFDKKNKMGRKTTKAIST